MRARVEQVILSDRLVRPPETVDAGLRRLEDALATLAEAVDSRLLNLERAVAETNRNINWLVQDGFPRMLGIVSKIGSDVEQVKGDVMAVKVDVALLNDRMKLVERHLGLAS